MDNIEQVRNFILKQFQTQMDIPFRNIGIEHTLQVVSYAIMLSKVRKIDSQEAIKNQSTKNRIHDALSELLKDADVLSHYYSGTILNSEEKTRLDQIL